MTLIANADQNWGIGYKDKLLVSIPEDMKHFRNETMGHTVVCGRKTLAGFPGGLPLKGRRNIVLSTKEDFTARDAIIAHSTQELFDILKGIDSDDIYIIGGGSIYNMMEPYCDEAIITRLDYSYQADTFFPDLDKKENWKIVDVSEEQTCFSIEYHFVRYKNESKLEMP
ncbi:dihydrofolate reductase [Lachnospiraceae bacterium]|nr:dihydrofolate reductase [Lachnospiraceae bacterium]